MKHKLKIDTLFLLLSPFLWFLYIELLDGWTPPKLIRYFMSETGKNCLVFYLYGLFLVWALFFLLRRIFGNRVGSVIASTVCAIFGITNYCVQSITGQPFCLSDLKIMGTAFSVLSEQSLSRQKIIWLLLAILLYIGYVIFCVYLLSQKHYERKQQIFRLLSSLLVMSFSFLTVLFCSDLSDTVLLYDSNHKYSAVTAFILTSDVSISFPDDVTAYLPESDRDSVSDFDPNIIIVMSEAFSDMQTVFSIESNQDAIPFFRSLCDTYPHGISYSSVRGNNTCSTEFEILSGVSTALTVKGAIIYESNAVPMQTLVSAMKARGYTTSAIHPYFAGGYNRNKVYSALGFDNILFKDDFTEPKTIREFISDESDFAKIIECYELSEKPFFCFNVTMQNHAGYTDDGGLTDKVTSDTGAEKETLDHYLTLLHESDRALEYLVSYFSAVEEPTVILFVGDHQPLIDLSFYEEQFGKSKDEFTLAELQKVYEIPYLIWANFPLNACAIPEKTSMNYLSEILFSVAGIEKTAWMDKLSQYRLEYPVLTVNFMEHNGVLSAVKDCTDTLLEIYRKQCYGILWGNRGETP